MAEHTTEALLEALFENRWPADVNPYRLNRLLGLRPWQPPLTEVWRRIDAPPPADMRGTAFYTSWPETAALVRELHAKYTAERRPSDDRATGERQP